MFSREPKVRLSDAAAFALTLKEIFQAGVDATNPGPPLEQFMMTPEQILAEQVRMETEADWIVNGGSGEQEEEED